MRDFEIDDLVRTAPEFSRKMEKLKKQNRSRVDPGWYPYPTMSSVACMDEMLRGENRKLAGLIGNLPVLDVGSGDGEMAFLLESFGATVDAIDYPSINFNRMRGIQVLKEALGSSVDIQTVDLDSQFALSRPLYGLTLLFGILYHLKNPFFVLEALARQSSYCLLSTRIARVAPEGARLDPMPIAYLVGERETNNDPTNYWIFTEAGLRRLIERTGWEIREFQTFGRKADSDPVAQERDERAFCLLHSRVADFTRELELGEGWYELETGRWRWTRASFAFSVGRPPAGIRDMSLRFYLPEALVESAGRVALTATVNGVTLGERVYTAAGEHVYAAGLPPEAMAEGHLEFGFRVDKPFSFVGDARELGVLVNFLGRNPFSFS